MSKYTYGFQKSKRHIIITVKGEEVCKTCTNEQRKGKSIE